MTPSLLKAISATPDLLPTCAHYKELLQYAHQLTGIPIETLRIGKGEWTYDEWGDYIAYHTPKF